MYSEDGRNNTLYWLFFQSMVNKSFSNSLKASNVSDIHVWTHFYFLCVRGNITSIRTFFTSKNRHYLHSFRECWLSFFCASGIVLGTELWQRMKETKKAKAEGSLSPLNQTCNTCQRDLFQQFFFFSNRRNYERKKISQVKANI